MHGRETNVMDSIVLLVISIYAVLAVQDGGHGKKHGNFIKALTVQAVASQEKVPNIDSLLLN